LKNKRQQANLKEDNEWGTCCMTCDAINSSSDKKIVKFGPCFLTTEQEATIAKFLKQFAMYYKYNYTTSMYRLKENIQNIERLVNTDEISIEGFINTHLHSLLNGSWHDIDKNFTYFDILIKPKMIMLY
jgi:hypothetical protein